MVVDRVSSSRGTRLACTLTLRAITVPWNNEEARTIVEQANQFENDLDENLVSRLAQVSSIDFAPMISVIGGMMAHEIVKAVTRYGCPVDQFMFYECSDVLPEVSPMLEPETSVSANILQLSISYQL